MVEVIHVSPEELARLQREARQQELAQRPQPARLEDVLRIRVRGARLIKPAGISFDDEA